GEVRRRALGVAVGAVRVGVPGIRIARPALADRLAVVVGRPVVCVRHRVLAWLLARLAALRGSPLRRGDACLRVSRSTPSPHVAPRALAARRRAHSPGTRTPRSRAARTASSYPASTWRATPIP